MCLTHRVEHCVAILTSTKCQYVLLFKKNLNKCILSSVNIFFLSDCWISQEIQTLCSTFVSFIKIHQVVTVSNLHTLFVGMIIIIEQHCDLSIK